VKPMVVVTEFSGKRVLVLGLAKSGRAAVRALLEGGAEVLAWDDGAKVRDSVAGEMTLVDPASVDWRSVAALVLSPGIPLTFPEPHPAVVWAREAGVEIIGDIELLGRALPRARYVGITGTNGKSTTTALIGHILGQSGQRVEIGGNLGTPALSLAPLDADGIYVLEASSFQLDLIETLAFDVAVLLNVTPDHLDRHGGMDGYIAAKKRIFARQGAGAAAVAGIDDAICRDIAEELRQVGKARVIPISVTREAPGGVYAEGGWLIDAIGERPERVLDLAGAERLPGSHNAQNAAAAYAASRALSASSARTRRRRSGRFLALPTARSWSGRSAGCATSTIRRRPTPTRPKRRWPATIRSTGFSAGCQRQGAAPRWRRISGACGTPI